MDRRCTEKIKFLLCNGRFFEAKQIIDDLSLPIISDTLLVIADELQSIIVYSFVNFLLINQESAQYHIIAARLFTIPLFSIPGAYDVALYHVRRALALDPSNVEYKESILFFYYIPDQLVSSEEALKIAREVIQEKPDSSGALSVLRDLADD